MTKEEIKELIRKEFDSRPHPNVKDDFDFIWDVHEKYFPFSDKDYKPIKKSHLIKTIDLSDSISKDKLLNEIENLPDDCSIYFNTDEYDEIVANVSVEKEEDFSMMIFRLYDNLHRWACMSNYAFCKRIYILEKENEELKKQLNYDCK